MTKKIDKIRRQKALLQQLDNDTYDREVFISLFHIRDRTIRRDLNDLVEKGEIFAERLKYLRKKCLGKLTKKVHEDKLSDDLMVKIALSGEVKKIEKTLDVTKKVGIIVKMWKPLDESAE